MADVEVHQHRGNGGGNGGSTWLIALLVAVVLAVVLWFVVVRPRGAERTDVNIEVDAPDVGGDTR